MNNAHLETGTPSALLQDMTATEKQIVDLAIGRILRLGSRPSQPGDVEEYERCKAIIMRLTGKGN